MRAIEIARKLAGLGQAERACASYSLAIHENNGGDPAEDLEAAAYILQAGGDYRVSYTCFRDLYNRGCFQNECLGIMTEAFYAPNEKALRSRYEKNCKLLRKYPYLFRNDFLPFEALPVRFYPYDDNAYTPFYVEEGRFGDYIKFNHPVISRNFFRDLDKPVLAQDVYSQYELEYLNDNVRKSEYVGRENHIYLHYTDWAEFCSYLQCLNLRPLLKDKKVVFLIEEEIGQYPIDFQARFGIDYSAFPLRPVGIREINRLIWHAQLSSHNGGDFFNEIFDAHPNLLTLPSLMFDSVKEAISGLRQAIGTAGSAAEAGRNVQNFDRRLGEELYLLKNPTDKDFLVAMFLRENRVNEQKHTPWLDRTARIVPAVFFQPHFSNIVYKLTIDQKHRTTLYSDEYEEVRVSPLFRGFKYIKTFTPIRRPTTSYAAGVKFMFAKAMSADRSSESVPIVSDALSERVLNRSFMIDWQDRLFMDSVLVRFEDGKLNPKAVFTALAAFLDLPYTESMTYCSLIGEKDPESYEGNEIGFSAKAVYRTYDDYSNDDERCFIEYFMRDVYQCYGYDFHYYDGAPMDEARADKLIDGFTTLDYYFRKAWTRNVSPRVKAVAEDGQEVTEEDLEKGRQGILDEQMKVISTQRRKNASLLLQGLRFVNKNGQPLHMMPKLELDPALLEQPLYH